MNSSCWPRRLAKARSQRLVYRYEEAGPHAFRKPPKLLARPARLNRIQVALAREWQHRRDVRKCVTRAALARRLRVSRARFTKVLDLLELPPEVVEALVALGDPLDKPLVTERALRSLLGLPAKEQKHVLRGITGTAAVDWQSVRQSRS